MRERARFSQLERSAGDCLILITRPERKTVDCPSFLPSLTRIQDVTRPPGPITISLLFRVPQTSSLCPGHTYTVSHKFTSFNGKESI